MVYQVYPSLKAHLTFKLRAGKQCTTHPKCNCVPHQAYLRWYLLGHKKQPLLVSIQGTGGTPWATLAFVRSSLRDSESVWEWWPAIHTIHMIHPLAVEDLTHKKVGQPSQKVNFLLDPCIFSHLLGSVGGTLGWVPGTFCCAQNAKVQICKGWIFMHPLVVLKDGKKWKDLKRCWISQVLYMYISSTVEKY